MVEGVPTADDGVSRDEFWMRRALELARAADRWNEVPVGAVVVMDDQEIAAACNAPISTQDPTGHAEIRAIRDAAARLGNYRLTGATLYVTIEPCTMCAGALVHSRIGRLVYGAVEPKAGAIESRSRVLEQPQMNWAIEVTGGVLAEECQQRISAFFARRRAEKRQMKADPGNSHDTGSEYSG